VRVELAEVHMGVRVRLVVHAASEAAARDAAAAAFARIRALDAVMSDYRPDSEVNRLSATSGAWVPVSDELFAVLALGRDIAEASDGAFDPTVGPLVTLWREARDAGRLPDPARVAEARARTGWAKLELDASRRAIRLASPGMRLDLGGIAKGFILDAAREALAARGVTRALLEAGGDIVAGRPPPGLPGWRIDVGRAEGELARRAAALTDAALATSGASAQFVEIDGVRYSHVIDPRTGLGLTHDRLVHVVAPDGATADALATAAGVLGAAGIAGLRQAFPGVAIVVHERRGTAPPAPRP
jgi:thiamine biosynthesis lipoprotein